MPVDKERPKKCQSSASRTYFFPQFYRHPERPLAVQLAQSEILLQPFATLERIRDVPRISYSNHGGRPSPLATLLTYSDWLSHLRLLGALGALLWTCPICEVAFLSWHIRT